MWGAPNRSTLTSVTSNRQFSLHVAVRVRLYIRVSLGKKIK